MCFEELTIDIQAKSEELAHLCMEIGKTEALLINKKEEKIRRAGELNKLFEELRNFKNHQNDIKTESKPEEETAEVKQDPAWKKLDIGKITSLRQAGWSVKDIAGELHTTNYQIRKALGME